MSNYPEGTGPNDPEAPWNPELDRELGKETKRITVYVRFAGVLEKEIEVPADFDCSDSEAVAEALNKYTRNNRPSWVTSDPEDWEFWNYGLGEFWYPSPNFNDPGRKHGMDTPRIFIEDVRED